MAWSELTRHQHARTGGRYASDLTDAEWAIIEPLMAVAQVHRQAARDRPAQCVRCDPLHCDNRLPVADVGERLSSGFDGAGFNGAGVFLRLAQ